MLKISIFRTKAARGGSPLQGASFDASTVHFETATARRIFWCIYCRATPANSPLCQRRPGFSFRRHGRGRWLEPVTSFLSLWWKSLAGIFLLPAMLKSAGHPWLQRASGWSCRPDPPLLSGCWLEAFRMFIRFRSHWRAECNGGYHSARKLTSRRVGQPQATASSRDMNHKFLIPEMPTSKPFLATARKY
jgi:hypothetical protein